MKKLILAFMLFLSFASNAQWQDTGSALNIYKSHDYEFFITNKVVDSIWFEADLTMLYLTKMYSTPKASVTFNSSQINGLNTAVQTFSDTRYLLNTFATNTDKTNWNTAYGWGNHATAGYATTASLSGKFDNPTGNTTQYLRGDGTLATFPTIPGARTFSTPTFASSTTATQLSATRDYYVQYAYDATVSISLLAGQTVSAILEYADNSGMTTNVVTLDAQSTSNSGVLNLTQTNTLKLSGFVPAGKYRRVRYVLTPSTSGPSAPTVLKSGQEVAF